MHTICMTGYLNVVQDMYSDGICSLAPTRSLSYTLLTVQDALTDGTVAVYLMSDNGS